MGKHSAPRSASEPRRPTEIFHEPPPNRGESRRVRAAYDAIADKSGSRRGTPEKGSHQS